MKKIKVLTHLYYLLKLYVEEGDILGLDIPLDDFEDFSISFYITPQATGSEGNMDINERRYIIAKSGTKTVPTYDTSSIDSDIESQPQYPFEIYMRSQSLYFSRSDGESVVTVFGEITSSNGVVEKTSHILCQNSSSKLEIYFDGTKIASQTYSLKGKPKMNLIYT